MNIIEALKQENIRVSNGTRWLVWEEQLEKWTVYERLHNVKKTRVICIVRSENIAISHLLLTDA